MEFTVRSVQVGGWFGGPDRNKVSEACRTAISEAAAEGWELIETVPVAAAYGHTAFIIHYFRRPRASE